MVNIFFIGANSADKLADQINAYIESWKEDWNVTKVDFSQVSFQDHQDNASHSFYAYLHRIRKNKEADQKKNDKKLKKK
jgi:hypothetical protein